MNRASRASNGPLGVRSAAALGLAVALGACARGAGLSEAALREPHPDGVAPPTASHLPAPAEDFAADLGFGVLRAPLGADRVHALLQAAFQAFAEESPDALVELATADAQQLPATLGGPAGARPLGPYWSQRFRRLDYTVLGRAGGLPDASVLLLRSLESFPGARPPGLRQEALGTGDVVLRVVLPEARVGAPRLFGPTLWFWLRPDGEAYRIFRLFEDFQPPT